MKKKSVFLLYLLMMGTMFTSSVSAAQKTASSPTQIQTPPLSATEEALLSFGKTLLELKKTLRSDKEKLHRSIKPDTLIKKINALLELGNKNSTEYLSFEKEHILFLKRIERQIRSILDEKKYISKSEIHEIHLSIYTATSLLAEEISKRKKEYILNRSLYQKYKEYLFDIEEELINETFNVELVSYRGLKDILEYNFWCNPLQGFGALSVIVVTFFALSELGDYLDKKSFKVKLESKKDSVESREKFIKQMSPPKKVSPPTAPKDEPKKNNSASQRNYNVSNCGAHAMFHAECFLKELERNTENELTTKELEEEFKKFWNEYLDWAKEKLPNSGIPHQNRDIQGDYISSDIVKHYFRKERKHANKVHIFEYGQTGSGIPELTLIENSAECPSAQETLEDLLDDESSRSENIRPFILEWANLLSGQSKEPIICILSDGNHWIVAKYELDKAKKINITLRDSMGKHSNIAQKPAQIILSLGSKKLQGYKYIIEHPSEKIIIQENQIFSDYLQDLLNISKKEEQLKNPFMQKLIAYIKERKAIKPTAEEKYLFKKIVFKTKVSAANSGITFAENEFKRTPLHLHLKLEEDDTVNVNFKLEHHTDKPEVGTDAYTEQEGLPWHEWIEKKFLHPLFKIALVEASK